MKGFISRRSLGIAMVLAATSPVAAPASGQVWDPRVVEVPVDGTVAVGRRLQPFTARWSAVSVRLDNTAVPLPDRVETTELVSAATGRVWKRSMRVIGADGTEQALQTNLLDGVTLAPLQTRETHRTGESLSLDFDARHVTGLQDPGDPKRRRAIAGDVRQPIFDYWNGSAGLLLASLPLRQNTEFRLPTLDVDGRDPTHVSITTAYVRGTQKMTLGNTSADAWIVDVPSAYGFFKYWIVAQPPYAVQWLFVGPNGGRVIYKWDQLKGG